MMTKGQTRLKSATETFSSSKSNFCKMVMITCQIYHLRSYSSSVMKIRESEGMDLNSLLRHLLIEKTLGTHFMSSSFSSCRHSVPKSYSMFHSYLSRSNMPKENNMWITVYSCQNITCILFLSLIKVEIQKLRYIPFVKLGWFKTSLSWSQVSLVNDRVKLGRVKQIHHYRMMITTRQESQLLTCSTIQTHICNERIHFSAQSKIQKILVIRLKSESISQMVLYDLLLQLEMVRVKLIRFNKRIILRLKSLEDWHNQYLHEILFLSTNCLHKRHILLK